MTKVTLTIDGQVVQAESGQTILEVARKNSIHIPTLCYHPLLEVCAACRLCIVEVIRKRSAPSRACGPAWRRPARILLGMVWK